MCEQRSETRDDTRVLMLADADNVCVATTHLEAGTRIRVGDREFLLQEPVGMGHKIAMVPIAAGEKVIKYGVPIGSATRDIAAGQHVHTHNLASDYLPTPVRRAAPAGNETAP